MAQVSELPCDGAGVCMVCKSKVAAEETLLCSTCVTPWHVTCLRSPPETLAAWNCPDCSDLGEKPAACGGGGGGGLVEMIRAIEGDDSLTEAEKARRRQELLSGKKEDEEKKNDVGGGVLGILGDKFNCSICMHLLDKPVSTPCGHNFCLRCFQKWVGQKQQCKTTCAICREPIPLKMAKDPRINSAMVLAIRMAKLSESNSSGGVQKVHHFIHNQDRPDKAFTTERARKSGKANACSGKIFVTVPIDFFGPITMEYDPERKQGVLVGETWEDRMECRQWGAHFPHVAGISGQSDQGAQSVALSGGYEDDEDHGDWFLYTGSGGRDLDGNKRTNKLQSFDQTFTKQNEALRVSCKQGYPVRVVRSHKEKRSSYAPEEGVRYDGVYRIEMCWRKAGIQGFKVCRYLFVRCDNEPAPWTSDNHGDCPRSLPNVPELEHASDITERKGSPAWGYDEDQGRWIWKRPQPESRKAASLHNNEGYCTKKRKCPRQKGSVKERLLKEFSCLICRKVMVLPLTTPCAHNFCKACLEGAFSGQSFVKERTCGGRRTLRAQKNVMKCPSCINDLSDFLQNPQVNRELMNVIESLLNQMKEESLEDEGIEDAVDENIEEESDVMDENKEKCDSKAEILKTGEDDEGKLEPSNDKACSSDEMLLTKPDDPVAGCGVEDGAGVSDTETEKKADKPKRSYKRKKARGLGH